MDLEQFKVDYFKEEDKVLVSAQQLQNVFKELTYLRRHKNISEEVVDKLQKHNSTLKVAIEVLKLKKDCPEYTELDLKV